MKNLLLILTIITSFDIFSQCSGGANCYACKNCTGCKHCAKQGGNCSACSDAYNTKAKRTITKPKSANVNTKKSIVETKYSNNKMSASNNEDIAVEEVEEIKKNINPDSLKLERKRLDSLYTIRNTLTPLDAIYLKIWHRKDSINRLKENEESNSKAYEPIKEEEIYTVVKEMPEFPGGVGEMMSFFSKQTQYPSKAKEAGLTGKCYLNFVVDLDGNIIKAKVVKGVPQCPECDVEALRVVNLMPKWKVGKHNGKPVLVLINTPFNFTLN